MSRTFSIGNVVAEPGDLKFGYLRCGLLKDGSAIDIPILVMNGAQPGPTLWLGSTMHGIEIGGYEIIRRIMREQVKPSQLRGVLIGAPIQNPLAFRMSERHTPQDRSDMNRIFGSPESNVTRFMASALYNRGIAKADYVVDYHSCNPPSLDFTIITQSGKEDVDHEVLAMARAYGATICRSEQNYAGGTLVSRALQDGKPSLTVELTFSRRFDESTIAVGLRGTLNIMKYLGMLEGPIEPQSDLTVLPGVQYYRVVASEQGGFVELLKGVGDPVRRGEVFAHIRNPFGDIVGEVTSEVDGNILAFPMGGNQAVDSGEKIAYLAHPVRQ